MGFVETEAIVLRKYNLSDADKIVVVLTEKRGLVRGVANGAKRLKSKFASSLEFFSRIHIHYFEKEERELVSIRNTDLVESVFGKLSNPEFYDAFAEIADLLIRFTPPNEPNERLYNMTKHCLMAGASNEKYVKSVKVYFEIWLLKLGGFLPEWNECAVCSKSLTGDTATGMGLDFRLICSDCERPRVPVSYVIRDCYNFAQRTGPKKFAKRVDERETDISGLAGVIAKISDAVLERAPTAAGTYDGPEIDAA